MKLHHLGYACENILAAIEYLRSRYEIKSISEIIYDELQNISVCLVEVENAPAIELVAGKIVKNFIRNTINFYHICYEIDDFYNSIDNYKKKGAIEIVAPLPAKLFNNRLVTFLQTNEGLIELLESDKQALLPSSYNLSQEHKLIITSTFKTVFVEHVFKYVFESLKLKFTIQFAPYNQVFQELLNPASLTRNNMQGFNVFFIRLEDIIPELNNKTQLENNILELIAAFEQINQAKIAPCIICFCPPSFPHNTDLYQKIIDSESKIINAATNFNELYFVSSAELVVKYPQYNFYDEFSDKVGHVPYTHSLEAALSLIALRKIYSITSSPYKVIVLDCDDTLWDGVCGELGPFGIKLTEIHLELQKFLVRQYQNGFLLCVNYYRLKAVASKYACKADYYAKASVL